MMTPHWQPTLHAVLNATAMILLIFGYFQIRRGRRDLHRIAMSAALLGLLAEGETVIDGAEAVDTSFPGFVELLRSLGADITEETP